MNDRKELNSPSTRAKAAEKVIEVAKEMRAYLLAPSKYLAFSGEHTLEAKVRVGKAFDEALEEYDRVR